MVPLVFKTSLGVVRFPEGSTPSLLRHISDPRLEIGKQPELHRENNRMRRNLL